MATTQTATIRLRDYNNDVKPVTYLWFVSTSQPTGCEFNDNTDSDGDDYCDVNQVVEELGLWDLEGKVADGRWEWNGDGNPTDHRGNSILNVKAI